MLRPNMTSKSYFNRADVRSRTLDNLGLCNRVEQETAFLRINTHCMLQVASSQQDRTSSRDVDLLPPEVTSLQALHFTRLGLSVSVFTIKLFSNSIGRRNNEKKLRVCKPVWLSENRVGRKKCEHGLKDTRLWIGA